MVVTVCPICIEPLLMSAECQIVSPPCGHVFHEHCLTNWLSEKSNCPSCRTKLKNSSVKRLYFESSSQSEGQSDEVASYVCQVESLAFELKLKKKEVEDYKEKAIQDVEMKKALRAEISKLENKVRKVKTNCADALNSQHSMLREMKSLKESLKEMDQLKADIDRYKKLDTVLYGSLESADSVLKTYDVGSDNLVMLASCFKSAYEDAKQSVMEKDKIIQRLTSENVSFKSKVSNLSSQISTQERVIETYRKRLSTSKSANNSISHSKFDSDVDTSQNFDLQSPGSSNRLVDLTGTSPEQSSPKFKPNYSHMKPPSLKRKPDSSPILNRKIKIVSSRLKRPQSQS